MYFVGLDGGASSTKCLVTNSKGKISGFGQSGPSNHLHGEKGIARLKQALRGSIGEAIKGLDKSSLNTICLGLTGVDSTGPNRDLVMDIVAEIIPVENIILKEDIKIALAGASTNQQGIVVYAGTGTNAYGIDERGKKVNVGGWGYIIDDKGAGYDIGCRALRESFRYFDGRGRSTTLMDSIKNHFDCETAQELKRTIYQDDGLPRQEIAALSTIVKEEADKGDSAAQTILEQAGSDLSELAITALDKLSTARTNLPVYRAGGVFNAGHWLLDSFKKEIHEEFPEIEILRPKFPPVCGALFLALDSTNQEIDENFLNSLRTGLKDLPIS